MNTYSISIDTARLPRLEGFTNLQRPGVEVGSNSITIRTGAHIFGGFLHEEISQAKIKSTWNVPGCRTWGRSRFHQNVVRGGYGYRRNSSFGQQNGKARIVLG